MARRHGKLTLLSTAAAAKEQEGDDDDPDDVVVKQIAKTVVHIVTSKDNSEWESPHLITIICEVWKMVQIFVE